MSSEKGSMSELPDQAKAWEADPLKPESGTKDAVDNSEVSTAYSRKKQLIAALCATLGCFLNGCVGGYTGPAIPSMMQPESTDVYGNKLDVTIQQVSWIASLLPIGCLTGALMSAPLMERLGRKNMLMLVVSTTFATSFALIFFAKTVVMLYIARFLAGLALGFELATANVYIVEIASTDMRGLLGCLVNFLGGLGILYTFSLGYFLDWKWLAVACAFWSIPFCVSMFFVPESPRWLLLKGREYSASRSLEWLRGRGDQAAIEREIEKIKRDIAFRRQQRVSVAQLGPFWKPFAILLAMNFFLNFSGFNVILFYTTTIFRMARSSIEPKLASVLLAVTLVVSGVVALAVVSRLKRKVMLVSSIFGMGVCQSVMAYCMLRSEEATRLAAAARAAAVAAAGNASLAGDEFSASVLDEPNVGFLGWLPFVAAVGFTFLGNVGYGTLIWVVVAELMPPKVRQIANSLIICFSFTVGFVSAKTFVDMVLSIGASGTFFTYAVVCFVGFVFTWLFVPETKGKSIEDIEKIFHQPCCAWIKDSIFCR